MSSDRASNSADELLQLNAAKNLEIIEENCKIDDLKVYCRVYKEKLNHLKNEVEKGETECKYLEELRDSKKRLYEEVKLREKRTKELIKANECKKELMIELLDLKKEQALELEKKNEIIEKKRKEVYEQSKRIFERQPIIIKRNKLRNQVEQQRFQTAYMKQKLSNLKEVYATLQKTEKQIEQNKIIKFAEAMVKYYKKQKEQEQINQTKKSEERNLLSDNFQKPAAQQKKSEVIPFSKSKQYDYLYKKQLTTDIGSQYNLSTKEKSRNIESPMINIKPLQPFSLNRNYQFDPKKYLTTNSFQGTKPSEHKYNEQPKHTLSNIMKMSETNFKSSIPKFQYSFEKFTSNQERIPTNQKKQSQEKRVQQFEKKQELKRQFESQETTSKQKVAKVSEPNKKTDINTRPETGERICLSQPESKNSSQQENSFISLSQDSQKSAKANSKKNEQNTAVKTTKINEFVNQKNLTMKQNPIFNIQSIETKTAEICLNKPQIFRFQTPIKKPSSSKQIPLEYNKQKPQVLNSPVSVSKQCASNEVLKQNPAELRKQNPSLNPMFNMPATTPLVPKNVQLMNPIPLETKSPYFKPTQEDTGMNTSAEDSDKIVNVSSGQPTSQISAEFTSDEYIDGTANQPTEIEQMLNSGVPIGFNNEGYNVMEYYEDNPEMDAMMQDGYMSPPDLQGDQYLDPNHSTNCPAPTSTSNNIFGAEQSTGNSFFSFGQPNPKSGNIFNMF